MKVIKKEKLKGQPLLTIEREYLFGLLTRKELYWAYRLSVGDYYLWRKYPTMSTVGDSLSFQLDALNKVSDYDAQNLT